MSWQNLTWLFFHKLTLNQEKGNNLYFKKFFGAFKSIIPCSICRDHYNEVIQNENQNISNFFDTNFNQRIYNAIYFL